MTFQHIYICLRSIIIQYSIEVNYIEVKSNPPDFKNRTNDVYKAFKAVYYTCNNIYIMYILYKKANMKSFLQ